MDLDAIFIVGFLTLGTYKLFELFAKRKERILMIEKLAQLCVNEEDNEKPLKIRLPFILEGNSNLGFSSLRISLLLIGIGAGCLFAFFIQYFTFAGYSLESYRDYFRKFGELIVLINFASISICGGIGLLIAFLVEQKMKRKEKEED